LNGDNDFCSLKVALINPANGLVGMKSQLLSEVTQESRLGWNHDGEI
jgi:hypothetical protein